MVIARTAQYHLNCQSFVDTPDRWRFELSEPGEAYCLEVSDFEPQMGYEHCSLLAVLRGLEALDRRAEVTLFTTSRYVQQGLRYGLPQWREAGWKWEHFDRMVSIKHLDLWKRIDHVLDFHSLRAVHWNRGLGRTPMLPTKRSQIRVHRLIRSEKLSLPVQHGARWRIDLPDGNLAGHHGFRPQAASRYTSLSVS